MVAIFVMLAIVPATMFFLHESLVGGAEVEDETETKHFGAITRMVVYLLTHNFVSDQDHAVSHALAAILLVLLATSDSSPDLRNPQG